MSIIKLADVITPDRILVPLRATHKRGVVRALAEVIATRTGLHEPDIRNGVMARGDLTTFGIGRGLALPHATVPGLRQVVGGFARLDTPVDFGAADGVPADLVMMLLAPEGEDRLLLRALAASVRRLRDREVAGKLRGTANPEALHIVLTSDGWRGGHVKIAA